MLYLEEQTQIIRHLDIEMREQSLMGNRAKTVEAMQLLIEAILDIESALAGNSIEVMADDESEY